MSAQYGVKSQLMLPLGTVLHGSYRIDGYLASGGFGNTYVSTDQRLGIKVVVKEFFLRGVASRSSDGTDLQISMGEDLAIFQQQMLKFRKVAQCLHTLNSEHIVKVNDLFDENGTSYYVMEFIDGGSVAHMIKASMAPLDEDSALGLSLQVLKALNVAHSQGLWHMDINPQNIMVNKQGVVKLIDFGPCKQLNPGSGPNATTILGYTPGYAPREQVDLNYSKFGPWTDIYALGATLYRMVTANDPPLPSDIDDDGEAAFSFPDTLSKPVRLLILSMMQLNRNRRPQSALEVQKRIEKIFVDQLIGEIESEPDSQAAPPPVPKPTSNQPSNVAKASKRLPTQHNVQLRQPIAKPTFYLWISIGVCICLLVAIIKAWLTPGIPWKRLALMALPMLASVFLSLKVRSLNRRGKYEKAVSTELCIILCYIAAPTLFVLAWID